MRVEHVLLLVACCATSRDDPTRALRVYNGLDDTANKHPYVILIYGILQQRVCSGTLITPEWVLTAGHCCLAVFGAFAISYGNVTRKPEPGVTSSLIDRFIVHPRFDAHMAAVRGISRLNDIGLMHVFPPVRMRAYGQVSALDYKSLIGLAVEFAGFGMTVLMGANLTVEDILEDFVRPLQLGEGVVKLCPQDVSHSLTRSYVCVAPKCSKTQFILQGDSGGPLFCDGRIVAVASQGQEMIRETYYTPVSPYLTWIHKVINSYTIIKRRRTYLSLFSLFSIIKLVINIFN